MIQTGLISPAHDDLVCEAVFDYYGTRLATCGLDQKIKIWRDASASQMNDYSGGDTSNNASGSGGWILEDEFKAHDAPILSLSWAHPEFGRMLVSGSMDRTVKIWEWVPGFLEGAIGGEAGSGSGAVNGTGAGPDGSRWRMHTVLTEAKGSVRAVRFAPPVFGLKFAALATDNLLRIYECLDSERFTNVDTVDVRSLPFHPPSSTPSASSFSGILGTNGGDVILEGGPDASSFLNTSSSNSAFTKDGNTTSNLDANGYVIKEADGGWTLSWCKDAYWGQILAVGCGIDGVIKIVKVCTLEQQNTALISLDPYSPSTSISSTTKPSSVPTSQSIQSTQKPPQPHRLALTSVSWAPTCGRSYHTIASGSRDGRVRIWKVKAPNPTVTSSGAGPNTGLPTIGISSDERGVVTAAGASGGGRWSVNLVGDFGEHEQRVSKVDWNITGTILTSSGADGTVRLWKASMGGIWRPMGSISAKQAGSGQPFGGVTGGHPRSGSEEDVDMDG